MFIFLSTVLWRLEEVTNLGKIDKIGFNEANKTHGITIQKTSWQTFFKKLKEYFIFILFNVLFFFFLFFFLCF
jgi:hypothetical protein